MCGRITLTNPADIFERFELAGTDVDQIDPPGPEQQLLMPRYNIAPSQTLATVVATPRGRVLQPMKWGYQPTWLKSAPKKPPPINARAETLVERPLFRGALERRRCVIPADGFYEWAKVPGAKAKQPYHLRLKGGSLFGFAGIFAGETGAPTCAVITTSANELVRPVHDRMPVILTPETEEIWLDPTVTNPVEVMACLQPYSVEAMEVYPVSTLVSSVRNDGPELLEPLHAA